MYEFEFVADNEITVRIYGSSLGKSFERVQKILGERVDIIKLISINERM